MFGVVITRCLPSFARATGQQRQSDHKLVACAFAGVKSPWCGASLGPGVALSASMLAAFSQATEDLVITSSCCSLPLVGCLAVSRLKLGGRVKHEVDIVCDLQAESILGNVNQVGSKHSEFNACYSSWVRVSNNPYSIDLHLLVGFTVVPSCASGCSSCAVSNKLQVAWSLEVASNTVFVGAKAS